MVKANHALSNSALVVISISSIRVYLVISTKDGVKSIRKEVIMIWVHKTSNKERTYVR